MNNTVTKGILAGVFAGLCLLLVGLSWYKPTMKLGVMHSLTGTMSSSELGLVDAIVLAVEEINQQGGLLGRQLEVVVRDGQSNPKLFAGIAQTLIEQDEVDVVFGCWTSSCRKSVIPIFERYNHLLYYPLQYEGLETSKHVIYLGAVPNQQVIPALEWSFGTLGNRVYLVGSDYIYPHAANRIIKDQVQLWHGNIVGEQYVPLGGSEFDAIVQDIKRLKPDVIFNTINGSSNIHFFKALRQQGVVSTDIPTFSFSMSETDLLNIDQQDIAGDYLVSNYLQSLDNKVNQAFIERFKRRFGKRRVISDAMQTAYTGVQLWAKAVTRAGSSQVDKVRQLATDMSIQGPSGMVYVEQATQHTWKSMRIAQVQYDRQLKSVWFSKVPIAPEPYPKSRSVDQWQAYLDALYKQWGGQWEARNESNNSDQ